MSGKWVCNCGGINPEGAYRCHLCKASGDTTGLPRMSTDAAEEMETVELNEAAQRGEERMKIWKLEIQEIEKSSPMAMITSSSRTPRHTRATEYYATQSGAKNRSAEIYEGAKKLLGFIPGVHVDIKEIEVKP